MRIGVFTAGRGCPKLAAECIASLRAQTFTDWIACVTVDGQDDKATYDACSAASAIAPMVLDPRILINWMRRVYSQRAILASIAALIDGFGKLGDPDILACLDLDDAIKPNALQRIHDAHEAGAWVSYGNWADQHGNENKHRPMTGDAFSHIRRVPWFLTHMLTFRVGIFRAIPNEYFRWNDGRGYYETGFDGSAMYAAADLAGADRITGIAEPIYVYNRGRPDNVLQKWPRDHRVSLFDEQRAKPRLHRMDP